MGMHTRAAEYTTFITFEPINRKSGGKATRITDLRKLREEKKKEEQPQACLNLSKRKITRVNKVTGGGPPIFF